MLVKVLTIYPQLSAEWLLRGEGNMLKNISTHDKPQAVNDSNKNDYELPPAILDKFLTTIKGQAEEIGVLREQIRQLEQRLGKTADNASIGATANVG
nr:MAG TPA_asm: zipper dimerization domain transcription factor-like protein [Caudoviricetes sp.]